MTRYIGLRIDGDKEPKIQTFELEASSIEAAWEALESMTGKDDWDELQLILTLEEAGILVSELNEIIFKGDM
jgi:hypothetical protein